MKKIFAGAAIGVSAFIAIMWFLEYLDYEGEKSFGYKQGQGIA